MRILWILLGLLGAAAVALGAYASHGTAFPDAYHQDVFEVAVRYHLTHLPALGLAALIGTLAPAPATTRYAGIAGVLFLAGMALFCGSLYVKGLGIADFTNPTAPTGGFLMMAGWLVLGWAGLGLVRRS